jgi:hypothetical protein
MAGAEKDVRGRGGADRSGTRGEAIRSRILHHLSDMQKGHTHVVTTTKAMAEALQLPTTTVAYAVRKLAAAGMLSTKSLGPRGQRFVVERTEPLRSARRGRTRAASGQYCPWCGQSVQPAWRYCTHCGQKLPQGGA